MIFQTDLISTKKYIIFRFISPVTTIIFIILYYILVGGSKINKISFLADINAPLWLRIVILILLFLFLVISVIGITNTIGKRGSVEFSDSHIRLIHTMELFNLSEIKDLRISLDSTKFKPIQGRGMLDGLGNNWISFRHDNIPISYEFALDSKEDENVLKDILKIWTEKKINYHLDLSAKNFWQRYFSSNV